MSTIKYIVCCAVACVGLFGDVSFGAFMGVCALLFYSVFGDAAPAKKDRYEREKPPQNKPYNPTDYDKQ